MNLSLFFYTEILSKIKIIFVKQIVIFSCCRISKLLFMKFFFSKNICLLQTNVFFIELFDKCIEQFVTIEISNVSIFVKNIYKKMIR